MYVQCVVYHAYYIHMPMGGRVMGLHPTPHLEGNYATLTPHIWKINVKAGYRTSMLFQIKKCGYEFAKLCFQVKDYDNAIRYVSTHFGAVSIMWCLWSV